jgi:hypothetical protein
MVAAFIAAANGRGAIKPEAHPSQLTDCLGQDLQEKIHG